MTVGPAGGTVSGGGMVIDIPAGALTKDEIIVIKTVADNTITPPQGSALLGSVYALEPENVTFAAPVTVSAQIDVAKRPLVGSIVLMRSPKAANQWQALGAVPAYEWRVQASTTHFSDWALMSSSEVIDAGPCTVKGMCGFMSGGSTTDDSSFTSSTFCNTSNTTNDLRCEAPSGSDNWTCACTGTAPFVHVQSGLLTSDQLADLWSTKCTGTCIPPKPPPPWFDAGQADAASD
jgi:hypothetical protein